MKLEERLTLEDVRGLLAYNPKTGVITNRIRRNPRAAAGAAAGCVGGHGYVVVGINGRLFRAHHLAWLLHYGMWPASSIDHINRNKLDNSISNLRLASDSEQMWNQRVRKNSTSGIKGVIWVKKLKKWQASACINYKRFTFGCFETKEEAAEAVRIGRERLHGQFACHA
jgi:hypothetical protein